MWEVRNGRMMETSGKKSSSGAGRFERLMRILIGCNADFILVDSLKNCMLFSNWCLLQKYRIYG